MAKLQDDDVQLLQKLRDGSNEAFEVVYQNYVPFIFKIAISILKDQKEAEDLCHDIFIELLEKSYEYDSSRGSMKAWLAVKTKNRCIDRLRKKKAILIDEMEEIVKNKQVINNMTEESVITNIQKRVINEALTQIPAEQRAVIEQAYFDGRTQRELAEQLKKPLGTVKSLVRYGLNNLRKQKVIMNWGKSSGGGEE